MTEVVFHKVSKTNSIFALVLSFLTDKALEKNMYGTCRKFIYL